MKTIMYLSFLLMALSTTAAENKKTQSVTIKTSIFCDHCLNCSSCGANIYSAIRKAEGIKYTSIDPEANTITVTYKPALTNADKIRKALTEAGFDADELKAVPEAYDKLDDCCKKP